MTWPTLVLMLTGATMAGQESATARPQAGEPPTVVLEDVEVTGRRGAARVAPEREYDGAAIDSFAAWDIAEVVARASERAGDTEAPIVIINGRKVADPSIFLGFPPDAMVRLEVLPPEAAALYGEAPGRRVMNLVMERRFKSTALQAGGSRPTAGGTSNLQMDIRQSSLADQAATNISGQFNRVNSLRVGERPNYTQAGDDAVTLRPDMRAFSASIGLSRPLGDWSASLRLDARSQRSRSVVAPAGAPVATGNDTDGLSATGGLNGTLMGWSAQAQFNLGLMRNQQDGLNDSRLLTQAFGVDLSANRTLKTLPTGALLVNVSTNLNGSVSDTQRTAFDGGQIDETRTTQNTQFRGGLTLPLSSRRGPDGEARAGLGDLTLTLGGNLLQSDVGEGQGLNADLAWGPIERLRFNATLSTGASTPTAQQLYAPLSYGEPTTIFDLTTGESVQIVPILGGNPDLRAQRNDQLMAGVYLGPFTSRRLQINLGYNRFETHDGIGQMTAPTPALEAAFPDRFIRDADGRLTAIDQRPLNLASSISEGTNFNLNGELPLPWRIDGEAQRVNVSLSHSYRLSDISRFGPGAPVLDRLAGVGGGQPRQEAGFYLDTNRGRWGVNVSGRWQAAYRLRRDEQPGPDDLEVDALATMGLRLSFNLMPRRTQNEVATTDGARPGRMSGGGQVTLEIENLFDARPNARLADGRPAPGYGRDDRDPIGRQVRLQLSKRF